MLSNINSLYKSDKQKATPCLIFDTIQLFIAIFNQIITLKVVAQNINNKKYLNYLIVKHVLQVYFSLIRFIKTW